MKKVLVMSKSPIQVLAIPASEKINAADHGSNFLPSRNAQGEVQTRVQANGTVTTPGSMLLGQTLKLQTIREDGSSFISTKTLVTFQGINQEDCPPIGTQMPGTLQTQISNKPFYIAKSGKPQQPVINPSTDEIMKDDKGLPYYQQVVFRAEDCEAQVFVEEPVLRNRVEAKGNIPAKSAKAPALTPEV